MKKWIINSCVLFGTLLFSLCLFEIILRIIGFSYPNFYEYDDIVGHRLYPRTEGWYQTEGKAYITISNHGLRDREHSKIKPPDTVRIAVLGDSYAEALQVPLEDTFWAIMEQRMNSCKPFGDKYIEVINFGISGYGTAQEFLWLRRYVWEYSPDIVLLAFLTGNDIRNNSKILEPDKFRPFFFFQDGMLELDNSFVNHPTYRWKTSWIWSLRRTLSRYSRTLQLLNKLKILYNSNKLNRHDRIQGEEIGLDNQIYTASKSLDWQDAWKITEALLLRMLTEAAAHNARFVVVTLSNSIQVHPDPEVRRRFIEKHQVNDLLYPDRRIEAFAQQEGIEILSLAPIFQQYAKNTGVFLHGFEDSSGFGHWNQHGHRLAGELLSRYFCEGSHWNAN